MAPPAAPLRPILAALVAVACLSVMDAFMKEAALAAGAYSATLTRAVFGTSIAVPLWLASGARWPGRQALRLHLLRGVLSAFMALTFFFALTILPLAETIAISFVAPVISLYLAAVFLHERIHPRAIIAAVLGLAGTLVIVGARIGTGGAAWDGGLALGLAAILTSTLLYAVNLVVARAQAQVAGPLEIASFHSGVGSLVLALGAPALFVLPGPGALGDIAAAAVMTVTGAVLLGWAYARAEAQVLVPLEYSAFVWAAILGWMVFAEPLTAPVAIGAALIVVGCLTATRRHPETSAL